MEPQERDLITTLLGRLKSTGGQPKEPEADALIRQAVAEQPDAPYYLVQTVLIQDLSLHNAQHKIAELEQQLSAAQQEAQQQAARPTSFLGGLFGSRQPAPPAPGGPPVGPWTRAPQVAQAPMAQPYPQPGYAPQPGGYGPQQGGYGPPPGGGFLGGGSGGGGFLRSAAATAAGVAGGALLFQGIESMFGRGGGGILGAQATPGLGETVINNYSGSDAAGGGQDWGGGGQDYSSDAGGGQDYGGGGQDYGGGGQDYGGGGQDYGGGGQDQDFGGGDFGGGDGGGGDNFSC